MRKYHAITHTFHTVPYNLMNAYHPHIFLILYVRGHKYYKKARILLVLYVYILVRPYIRRYFLTQSYKNTAKHPSYTFSPSTIIHMPLSTFLPFPGTRKNPLHCSQNITRQHPMSSWNPTPFTAPGGGGTAPTYARRNWQPECPKSPGRKPITQNHPTAKLLEYCGPTKITKL